MNATNWLSLTVQRGLESQDASGDSIFVASTAAPDRAGDIVEQDWELAQFASNPVILWAHRYDLPPVGKGAVEVRDGVLYVRVSWDTASESGAEVMRQVKQGYLSAVSVGFRPGETVSRRMLEDGDPRKGADGYVYRRNQLLEVSVVPVPANAQATVVSRSVIDPAQMVECVRRGLPAPGEVGVFVDAVVRGVRAEVRAELADDAAFLDALTLRVAERVGKAIEPTVTKRGDDPWAGYFPQPRNEWAGWFDDQG